MSICIFLDEKTKVDKTVESFQKAAIKKASLQEFIRKREHVFNSQRV